MCPVRDANLHMAQLMTLSLTISCSGKSKLVLPFWYRITRAVLDKKWLNGCCCCRRNWVCYNASQQVMVNINGPCDVLRHNQSSSSCAKSWMLSVIDNLTGNSHQLTVDYTWQWLMCQLKIIHNSEVGAAISTKPPKGISLHESTSFEPSSTKILWQVWPVLVL